MNSTPRLLTLLFCLACSAASQVIDPSKLPGAAPADADAHRAADRRITLDVVVTDKSRKPVAGLEQGDFTVIDNKQPEKLVSFQAVEGAKADPPLEVILLLDRINTPFALFAQERLETKKFLLRNGGQLEQPVSIIFLSDTGGTSLPASRDGNALSAAVDKADTALRIVNRSQGVYGAIDRFQMSLSALMSLAAAEEQRPGRKMLIWISPGWPFLSGPDVQLTSKEQQGLFNSVVTASTALRQARIALYSIDPIGVADAAGIRTTYYKEFLKGVTAPRSVQAGNLALEVLAAQSGGKVLNSGNDVASEIASCMADAAAWYVLSFDSPPADGPNEYHALDVKVDKRGLTAQTRAGYYAQP